MTCLFDIKDLNLQKLISNIMVKNIKKLAIWSFASMMAIGAVSCGGHDQQPTSNPVNPTIDCIMTRKSVRQFANREVSAETIETLLKAGMAAPSAMNKQPWKFVVVQDKQLLKTLADTMPNIRTTTAPLAIVVCGDMSIVDKSGNPSVNWQFDCSAATQNLLLAAEAMGLGAVWTGVHPYEDRLAAVKRALILPEHIIPLNVIPIGYPKGEALPKDKYAAENIHYNGW